MNIYGTSATAAYTHTGGTTTTTKGTESTTSFNDLLQAATGTEKHQASGSTVSAESRWKQVADRFDVTNISTRERGELTGALLENNLISSAEGLALAAPYSMNENLDTKRDYLATSRDALEFSKQNGASAQQVELQQRVVSILETLFASSQGVAGKNTWSDIGAQV